MSNPRRVVHVDCRLCQIDSVFLETIGKHASSVPAIRVGSRIRIRVRVGLRIIGECAPCV